MTEKYAAGVEVCGEVRNCVECQHFPDLNNQGPNLMNLNCLPPPAHI